MKFLNRFVNSTAKSSFVLVICIIASILLCSSNCYSANSDSTYYKNPESFIAQQIIDNKIVLVGDVNHHNYECYQTLINVLYTLIDDVAALKDSSTNVTLVLEIGPKEARIINNYITTGSPNEIVDELIPEIYYEDFEFFHNLKKIVSYTKNSELKKKIKFNIEGFEPIDFTKNEIIKFTPWQLDSAFLIRDSILSINIINYITENPDSKIIIFYGDGHVQNGLQLKPTYGTHGEIFGLFMAEYLKRQYGTEKVVTFGQKWLNRDFFKGTQFSEFEYSNIVVPGNLVDIPNFPYPQNYDYCVFWNNVYDFNLPSRFNLVFSRQNIDKHIEFFKNCDDYIGNQQAEVYVNSRLFYFNFINCSDFKDHYQVLKSNGYDKYNGMEILRSDCFKKRLYEVYSHSNSKNLLKLLGFRAIDIEIGETADTLKTFNEIWDVNLQRIIFLNQIGVMWIGYPDEKKVAKDYLVQYSGKDFDNPADYLNWYRNEAK